jgi:hypothetical protein
MIAPLRHARLIEHRAVNKTEALKQTTYLLKSAGLRLSATNSRNAKGHDEEFPLQSSAVSTDDSFEAMH